MLILITLPQEPTVYNEDDKSYQLSGSDVWWYEKKYL